MTQAMTEATAQTTATPPAGSAAVEGNLGYPSERLRRSSGAHVSSTLPKPPRAAGNGQRQRPTRRWMWSGSSRADVGEGDFGRVAGVDAAEPFIAIARRRVPPG